MNMAIKRLIMSAFVAMPLLFAQQAATADLIAQQAATADLSEAATNPVSNLIQFRMQNEYTASSYNADSWGNTVLVQGVVPVPSLASKFDSLKGIVTRTTATYRSTPKIEGAGGRHTALGDTGFLAFAVPRASPKKMILGIGPALTFPTAGDNEYVGSGQWQAGPAVVVMVVPVPGLQVGALVFQQWDFASVRSDARDVSRTFIQPILTKHFSKGWYVSLPDTPQGYDWKSDHWTLNLGAVLGRVFPIGGQAMQMFGGVYYNSEDNGVPAAEWTFKFQVGWLFPQ
jgi:hypothetical protein